MIEKKFNLLKPKFIPPLDEGFRPAVLANRAFERAVSEVGVPLVIGLEREGGKLSRFETRVYPEGHPQAEANLYYVERIVKFLLWQRGGYKVYVGGSPSIAEYLKSAYSPAGEHQFDNHFMGEQVYGQPFQVVACDVDEVPPAFEAGASLGGHLDGCRIGFDLGGSDRKASAVVDGKVVFSEEVIW